MTEKATEGVTSQSRTMTYLSLFNSRFMIAAGAGLAFVHLLTAFSWLYSKFYISYASDGPRAACHAFFLSCTDVVISTTTSIALLSLYAFLSAACLTLFLGRKLKPALAILFAITLFKIAAFSLRFNVMGNYHLLHFLQVVVFFLLPRKRFSLTLSLVVMYILAAILKFNKEWLSGAALVGAPIFTEKWLSLALAYVIVLECVVVWGLLFKSRWVRAITLLQLTVFHLFSWTLVGYFYPLTMLGLLLPQYYSVFKDDAPRFGFKDLRPATAIAFFFIFLFDLAPLAKGDDPALSGEFRSLRINMLDARPKCRAMAFLEEKGQITSLSLEKLNSLRVRCDSAVFETQLRSYCKNMERDQKIRYVLYSKRETDSQYSVIRNEENICKKFFDANF